MAVGQRAWTCHLRPTTAEALNPGSLQQCGFVGEKKLIIVLPRLFRRQTQFRLGLITRGPRASTSMPAPKRLLPTLVTFLLRRMGDVAGCKGLDQAQSADTSSRRLCLNMGSKSTWQEQ
jgi:hypothetical protein